MTSPTPQEACRAALTDFLGRAHYEGDVYLPNFTLCLYALRDNQGIESAMPTGWRVLMPDTGNGALLAQVTESTAETPSQVISVSEGTRAQLAFDRWRAVQAMPQTNLAGLRWLSVPGVMFEGLWLQSRGKDEPDMVISVFTLDDELKERTMTAAQFLPMVREYAVFRLAHDDRPDYGMIAPGGLPAGYR